MTPAEAIAKLRRLANLELVVMSAEHANQWHAVADTLEAAIPAGTVVDLGVWEVPPQPEELTPLLMRLRSPGHFELLFDDSAAETVHQQVCLQRGKRYQVHAIVKEVESES